MEASVCQHAFCQQVLSSKMVDRTQAQHGKPMSHSECSSNAHIGIPPTYDAIYVQVFKACRHTEHPTISSRLLLVCTVLQVSRRGCYLSRVHTICAPGVAACAMLIL